MNVSFFKTACSCKCPQCGQGNLYKPGLTVTLMDQCSECGLALAENDNGDGPAVFLIFILGFLLVPLALVFEWAFAPPLWVHGVLWSVVVLTITLGALRPVKSCIIALQFKLKHQDGK